MSLLELHVPVYGVRAASAAVQRHLSLELMAGPARSGVILISPSKYPRREIPQMGAGIILARETVITALDRRLNDGLLVPLSEVRR